MRFSSRVGDAGIQLAGELLHAGDHAEQVAHRAELLHHLQLVAEVLERELVLAELLLERLGLLLVVGLLDLLDQRQDVALAEDPRRHAVGVEGLERLELLAHADEEDRRPGDGADRERGAAAGVAVELGEDDAVDLRAARGTPARR